MLVLSESPIGFALFSVTDEGKIGKDDLYKDFETAEGANSLSVPPKPPPCAPGRPCYQQHRCSTCSRVESSRGASVAAGAEVS